MRPRRLIVLLIVALTLGAYYGLVEVPRQAREELLRQTANELVDLDPNDVARVHIARADADLKFVIDNTHWEMTSPLVDLADQAAVGRLIASVTESRVERRLAPADDLSRYGLADPVARMVFMSARGDTLFDIALGANTINNDFAYAMTDADAVLLLPTAVRRYALTAIEDFRNKRPVIFALSQVVSFSVISDQRDMRWFQYAPEQWRTIVAGDTIRGDTQSVIALLRRLRGLRARGFLPDGAVAFAGVPSVTLTMTNNTRLRVHFTATERGVFSQVDGESRIVQVDSTALKVFLPDVADLRDRYVLHFSPERVARITVTTRDTTATIVRAGDGWGSPNPATGAFSARRIERFWRGLDGLRYSAILRAVPAPTVTSLDNDPTFSLAVYARGDTILDEMWSGPAPVATGLAPATSRSSRVLGTIVADDIDALVRLVRELRTP